MMTSLSRDRRRVAITYRPTSEGFLSFVDGLRSPMIPEAIAAAEPLSPVFCYRATENQRRFYERLRRFPARWLVTGDAVAAFNPIYCQGMTAAAQAALTLNRLLRDRASGGLTRLGPRFHRAIARANAAPG